MHRLIIVVTTLLLISTNLSAQTFVGGDITGIWTHESSPYIVISDINVVDSLIIKPGITVQFSSGGYKIEAGNGDKFVARGTEYSTIIFEPALGKIPGSWGGISLNNSGKDDTLECCVIRYATNGVYAFDSEPAINECTIYGNSENGVFLDYFHDADSAIVSNCLIYDNVTSGVRLRGYDRYGVNVSATCDIYGSTIYGNLQNGVLVTSGTWYTWYNAYALARITNCTICNCSTGIRAYAYRGYADAFIINNIIAYNTGYGIVNQDVRSYINANDINSNCFWGNGDDFSSDISDPGFGENGDYENCNIDSCDINRNVYCDPLFMDTINSDYLLQETSKCINSGHHIILAQKILDPDSTLPDIGAFYFHVTTGDANGNGNVSVSDVVYLVAYLYKGGPPPVPIQTIGDPNCNCEVTISDIVYLINYLYKGGPQPGC